MFVNDDCHHIMLRYSSWNISALTDCVALLSIQRQTIGVPQFVKAGITNCYNNQFGFVALIQ